ncbi:MAG: tetratricopeptide repeat protein [Thermoguttaceae bacterium]|nr:tetratricopeptide repeat protein [Thermoguttaceae bacterium]
MKRILQSCFARHFDRQRARVLAAAAFLALFNIVCLSGCSTFTANNYNAEGVRLLAQHRTEEALNCFEKAKNADPTSPDSYYNSGVVYHKRAIETGHEQDFQMAKYCYELCLQRSPNHVECNRSLATLYCDIGQNDYAFRLVEEWVARVPNSAEPRIELARLYDEHKQLGKARDCLNDAVAIDNQNLRAYTALGHVRERMGDTENAIAAYEHALALNPYQPEVHNRVAALRYQDTAPTLSPIHPNTPGRENAVDPGNREMLATEPKEGSAVH